MLKKVSAKKKSTACWGCFRKKREGCLYVNGGIVNVVTTGALPTVVGDDHATEAEDDGHIEEAAKPENSEGVVQDTAPNMKQERVKTQSTARIIKRGEVERPPAKGSAYFYLRTWMTGPLTFLDRVDCCSQVSAAKGLKYFIFP
jgi:hypothetical protein